MMSLLGLVKLQKIKDINDNDRSLPLRSLKIFLYKEKGVQYEVKKSQNFNKIGKKDYNKKSKSQNFAK